MRICDWSVVVTMSLVDLSSEKLHGVTVVGLIPGSTIAWVWQLFPNIRTISSVPFHGSLQPNHLRCGTASHELGFRSLVVVEKQLKSYTLHQVYFVAKC